MKKTYFIVLLLLLTLEISQARAEDYISDKVPSDDILMKIIGKKGKQIIGKFKKSDNEYVVYFGKSAYDTMELFKLDNNKWMFHAVGSDDGTLVLQK